MQRLLLGVTLTALCNVSYSCYRPPVKIAELNGQPIVRIRADDILEFQPLQKTKAPRNWELSIHTGNLRKQPN